MALVKNVEKKIWDIEGFDVRIKRENGSNIRSDKSGITQYAYTRAAKNQMTVSEWKQSRFNNIYCGLDVDVLDGSGNSISGQTKLGTVRDTYCED